ncbi:MAG TPA: hypothetical protein VF245_02440 [Solirubrobacterales bacterium]
MLAATAKDTAAQVVKVPPSALVALTLGIQQVLSLLERALVNQRLMPSFEDLALVGNKSQVVGVAQDLGQAFEADRTFGILFGGTGTQTPLLHDGRQLHQRVVAAGIEPEGILDQRRACWIKYYVSHRTTIDVNGRIAIANRGSARCPSNFNLLFLCAPDFNG